MQIAIMGVSGFIGRRVYDALGLAGHGVTGFSRHPVPGVRWQVLDWQWTAAQWQARLQGMDVVVNAVGIFEETGAQDFARVHDAGARALFAACAQAGVGVIQVSAIGAQEAQAVTAFLRSKRSADQYLLSLKLPALIIYPGIVLGEGGRSTGQLAQLARLWWIPLVFKRHTPLPLVGIGQLTDYIVAQLQQWPTAVRSEVLLARAEPVEQTMTNLRRWMGLGRGRFIYIPQCWLRLLFRLWPSLSMGVFNRQSFLLLQRDNSRQFPPRFTETASEALLHQAPTPAFIKQLRERALGLLNLSCLSLIWLISGLSSVLNMTLSRELIAPLGLGPAMGDALVSTAAAADLLLGLTLWWPRTRRITVYLQWLLMGAYTLVITIFMPLLWLHPFAPVAKNLAVWLMGLYLLQGRRRS